MIRYVMVGAGPAAIAAAEAIRTVDTAGEIIIVSEESYGYYSRPGLAYVLSGEIHEKNIYPYRSEDLRCLNIKMVHGRVTRIFPDSAQCELQNGSLLAYDKLLLATGSSAVLSNAPGAKLEGVIKLDSLDDAHRIMRLAKRGRTAVVVGGGITALELVEGFIAHGVKTHYLLRGDRYWSNVLDPAESVIVEERLKHEGVQIHYQSEIAEILGKNGHVRGVKLADGKEIKCDIVAVAIGVRPRKELADASGIKTEKGIVVNDLLQTSASDVYAAGDVAQVYDPHTGKSILDTLWTPAREQGFVAGLNMAGKTTIFRKPVAFNVTRLAGLTTTIIGMVGSGVDADLVGIARGDSETWRQLPDAIAAQEDFDVNRLRLLVGENSLLGALVLGDQKLSRPLQHIVGQRADISPVRDRLLSHSSPLGDVIADFWTHWRGAYAAKQT